MKTYKLAPRPITGVALFNMPYLYSAKDPDFHMEMAKLGIKRSGPILCGLPEKAIITDKSNEYYMIDYADADALCRDIGLIPTYTVDDFVAEIKKLKTYEE